MWREDSRKEVSNVKYYKRKLEEEERHSNWMANRIRELEKEISDLKHRPFWKWIWNDIKPKPRYSCGYNRWYKWEDFLMKVLWIMIAINFAIIVFVGNYYLLKYANMYKRLY